MSIWLTARFMRKGNYLNGSFIKLPDVDGYINSLNPGDQHDTLGRFPFSETGADIAVGCARAALPGWHRATSESRRAALMRFKTQLETSVEQLSVYLTRETGKPFWESRSEVNTTIRRLEVTLEQSARELEAWRSNEIEGGCEFHPRGVVAVLGSFSMPLLDACAHILPALLAGNTVVFKPSKYTPAVGQLIAEMIDRARLPRGVFSLVQGNGATVGKRLVTHPDVDAIHLEGSIDTGLEIKQLTLQQPWKRLVLNTCGRGTSVVMEDADLDKAVHEVVKGAFISAGQRRSSCARVIVTAPVAERFTARLQQVMKRIVVGYGLTQDVFCGPLISEKYRKVYLAYVEGMGQEGHDVLVQGQRLDLPSGGFFVSPTLVEVNPSLKREMPSSEFIVGPALELMVADDFEHAVALHNQSRLGLVTSLFTHRPEYIRESRYAFRVGAININLSTIIFAGKLPLEGQGASGNGQPGGLFSLRTVSYPQAWLEDTSTFDPANVMPGLSWPTQPPQDDAPTRILPAIQDQDDELGDMTVSDLLIPQDEDAMASLPVSLVPPPAPGMPPLPFVPTPPLAVVAPQPFRPMAVDLRSAAPATAPAHKAEEQTPVVRAAEGLQLPPLGSDDDETPTDEETLELPPTLPPLPDFDTEALGISDMPTIQLHPEPLHHHPQQPRVVINAGAGRPPVIDEDEITPPMGMAPIR